MIYIIFIKEIFYLKNVGSCCECVTYNKTTYVNLWVLIACVCSVLFFVAIQEILFMAPLWLAFLLTLHLYDIMISHMKDSRVI